MQPETEKIPGAAPRVAISPTVAQAQEAFRRDLPELLKQPSTARAWVAYHGGRRVGFGKTKTEVFQECLRQGLRRGEFIVRAVEPEVSHDIDLSHDV
jgi:hypothetical protein